MPSTVPQQGSAPGPAQTQTQSQSHGDAGLPPTLTLRGEPRRAQRRGIRWAADVIDNEGMGKKSSKVCCIYHKPRAVGESSSESDSSSDSSSSSDSNSEPENSTARMGGKGKSRRQSRKKQSNHKHDDTCDHDHEETGDGGASDDGKVEIRPSGNAYERMPKVRTKKSVSSTMTEMQR